MSDTKDKSNRSIGQRGSSSRLSASAKPFNWSTHVKEYDFGQQSFSSFSLFDYGGCYDQSLHSDSNAMPSSFPKATQDAIFGDHFSLLSCNEFPRQGAEDSLGDSAFMKEPQSLLNANDKIISHGKDTIGKGTEKKSSELANNGTINSMFVATSELLITSLDTPAFSLKPNGNESGVPVQSSSVVLAQNDSDVDSPCWKGTAAYESPFGGTKPMDSQLPKSEIEALKTLNPHAPDFIPESAKQFAEFHESECHGNAPFSFLMDPSPVATFSSNEQKFVDSVKAGTFSSKGSNVIGTRCFDNFYDGGKKYSLAKKSESCSEPNSLLGDQPFLVEDCLTSSGQGLTRTNITGSMKDTEDTVWNGSSCVTSAVTGNFRTSSCSRDAVPSLVDEKLQGASKSTSPKLDVQSVISTMHELSKLLLWNYSNDLGSVNEHEHDMILHIINNLYKCMPKKLGQRVSIPESGHHCTLDCPMKLPDRKKESKLTELKNKIIPHDLERQKGCSTTFEKKVSSPSK